MFNNTTYKSETIVTPVTTVIKETITPDKVTEMYDQIREEVLNSIVRTYVVETNSLNFGVVEYINQLEALVTKYRTCFKLNGREYIVDGELLPEITHTENVDQVIEKVRKRYAEIISQELIKEKPQLHYKMITSN